MILNFQFYEFLAGSTLNSKPRLFGLSCSREFVVAQKQDFVLVFDKLVQFYCFTSTMQWGYNCEATFLQDPEIVSSKTRIVLLCLFFVPCMR